MKTKSKISLTARMILSILGSILVMNIIMLVIIGIRTSREAKDSAKEVAVLQSEGVSSEVKNYLDQAFETTNTISNSLLALRMENNVKRRDVANLLQEILKRNDSYLAAWTMWESNAFDNEDTKYLNDPLYSETQGRLNLTYYKVNGQIVNEACSFDQYTEDYYTIPKSNGKQTIMEPYYYTYTGDEKDNIYETSVIVPVFVNGTFSGVVGIDIELGTLQKIISSIKLYETGFSAIVSNELQIAAYPNKAYIGKYLKDISISNFNEVETAVNTGNIYSYSDLSGKKVLRCFTPIQIGKADKPWSVMVEVPMNEISVKAQQILILISIIGIVSLVLISIIVYIISKSITSPVLKSVEFAKEIAHGNLDARINITNRGDELGELIASLSEMATRLKEIVESIMSGADNIVSSSGQLSSTSQQLSQGANEQASSVEEISSAMEEMVSNIQQNTDNARQTETISQKAQTGIKDVENRSKKSLDANRVIAEKIKIINDIAFQTNILALNAAVEAARAGEHGRGFAVVAAEVRKLAERSKTAADEIVSLAQTSHELAEGAGNKMMEIIPDIEKTTRLVQEISAASLEQNNGAEQINNAIQQLNDVTQQNAAASEELATNAEELAGQALQLKDMVSYFRF
jgi:methyl-accepting chemotaxis protein